MTKDKMIDNNSQKIFNNSLLYAIGTIASKATAFLLIPLYTFNLSLDEYGIVTTITTFVSTFGIVIMLSLRAAIMRFLNDYDQEKSKIFIGTITITVLVNSLLVCFLLCLLRNFYKGWLFPGVSFFPYVFIGVISLGFEGVYLIFQSVLQAQQKGVLYSINSFVYLLVNVSLVVLFLVVFDLSVIGALLANLFTNLLFSIYGIIEMLRRRLMVFKFNKAFFSKSLKYSLPILPHNLANDLNTYSSKVIINNCLDYAMTGLYSLASQFSSMVNLVQGSINLAFRPWFIEQMNRGKEGRKQIKYMSNMIMSLFCFIAIILCVFSYEILTIFANNDYIGAWTIIPLFVFAQLITFIYYSNVQTLMYNIKMSKFTSVSSITGLMINILLSLILVKPLGVYGIAIAQVVSKAVLSVIVIIFNYKSDKVDFGLKKMFDMLLFAAFFIGASICIILFVDSIIISLILRIIIVMVAFLVYILNYLSDFKILFSKIKLKKENL